MTKSERSTERSFAANDEEVEIASSDGEGPHEGLAGTRNSQVRNLLPFELPRRDEGELANREILLLAKPIGSLLPNR